MEPIRTHAQHHVGSATQQTTNSTQFAAQHCTSANHDHFTSLLRCVVCYSAGLTVALINIPLSVSLAVASQSTPTAGIITAVWAGLVAAVLGGSQFNITGPTGALAGILTNYALLFGADVLPLLSITSAVLIAVMYLLQWDKYMVSSCTVDICMQCERSHSSHRRPLTDLVLCFVFVMWQRYLPSSIVHGFTLGVGVMIATSQLSSALGIQNVTVRGSCFLNIVETLSHIGSSDAWAASVFAVSWLSLFGLIRIQPRLPWSVLIAAAGIGWGSANNTTAHTGAAAAAHYRLHFALSRCANMRTVCIYLRV